MQSPREILADLWALSGGEPAALDALTLTGVEPQLPSSFRVAAAAQTSIAAAALAAANVWKLRSGQSQDVAVDMRHAVVECRSERYLRVEGTPPLDARCAFRPPAHQFPPPPRRRVPRSQLQGGT
jgi:hypothetical protein